VDRAEVVAMDEADELTQLRQHFSIPEDGPIYLDGNSLGPPPSAVGAAVIHALDEWRLRLVGGWEEWIDLPTKIGDRLGRLLGAAPGQVLVCDSTTINLYKVVAAALETGTDRGEIVADAGDFPTDRYVLQGLSRSTGRRLRLLHDPTSDEVIDALGSDTALVCLSHVDFRTGRRLDGARICQAARDAGTLTIWDLAHSAGAVPLELDDWGADLAVGCTYKYLNAGPGAPGFVYVRRDLQDLLGQPIWGWFGQARQFEMGENYEPAPGITSFLAGTPGLIGLRAVEAALGVTDQVGVGALWAKSVRLTELLLDRVDERLVPLGAKVVTPRQPDQRGSHVSISHPKARPWCRTLIEQRLVVGDFRPPDIFRLGPAPLYTRFVDCFDAVEEMARTLEAGIDETAPSGRVT
jgi:kynureninase